MVSLVETIARSLVDSPDEVVVREIPGNDPGVTVVELKVAASDMGKIIGKQGRIVKALRTRENGTPEEILDDAHY